MKRIMNRFLLNVIAALVLSQGLAVAQSDLRLVGENGLEFSPLAGATAKVNGNTVEVSTKGVNSGIRFHTDLDVSEYSSLRFKLTNKRNSFILMAVQIQDTIYNANNNKQDKGAMSDRLLIFPNETREVVIPLPAKLPYPEIYNGFKGLRNTPYSIDEHYSYSVDLSSVKMIKINAFKHFDGAEYSITDLRFARGEKARLAPWMEWDKSRFFPFVDRYGQFKHKDWPGKTHSDEDLRKAREKEEEYLRAHTGAGDWSRYGGWKNGPRFEATGHFRVQKVDGKWWMIDPDGYLFWSHGVVRVTTSTGITPLDGRKEYFEDLPGKGTKMSRFYETYDALLKPYYTVRGIRETYDYSSANAYRKYGEDYKNVFADLAHRRLRSWGLNTIANSSDKDICLMDRTVYTDRIEISSPIIEGTGGSWWKFMDPFNDGFAESVRSRLVARKRQLDDPWCLGYFVDNEIKWGDTEYLASCTIMAPATQKAKIAMVDWLKGRYQDIQRLNGAWKTSFSSWDALLENRNRVPASAKKDLKEFNVKIIEAYFSTVRRVFKEVAPDVLYLGCRFSGSNADVLNIAAKYCDVLSYNIYRPDLYDFSLPDGIDKPVMIGEFHFGAMDRGMFHPGLIYTRNQNERADMYYRYVKSAMEHPNVIGTHWHQFSDQACTGRFDGENYQVGFTDICDSPYYETVDKVREVGCEMYGIRSGRLASKRDDAVYVDASELGVYGKAGEVPEHPYSRIDPKKYGIKGSLATKCLQSAGVFVAFSTDSKSISAKWKTSPLAVVGVNTGANAQKGLDLYIKKDGRWVFAGVGSPDMKGDCIHHSRTIISSMPEGTKECLLYLPLFDVVDSIEIGVDPGSSISALPNPFAHKIVFLGSSITHGSAASRAGMSYVARYGRDNGLYCLNLGFSGQAKLQEYWARVAADIDADAFVFDQFSNPSAKVINESFDSFVDIIREAHPETPLIFLQTIRRERRNFNEEADAYEAAKQKAGEAKVRARMKTDKNIYFIPSDGFIGDDSLGTADGTHPTDVGFSRMLEKMSPKLNKILKKCIR